MCYELCIFINILLLFPYLFKLYVYFFVYDDNCICLILCMSIKDFIILLRKTSEEKRPQRLK